MDLLDFRENIGYLQGVIASLEYQIFIKYGFTWGGSWANIKDYQHFQK